MLPEIQLDQQRFEEIIEDAKKQIAKVYPQWTNHNEADPGITFLELFSWLKEMQQYHLDQIGESNERKFLKLLGIWPEPMRAASVLLNISGFETNQLLLDREQFFADRVSFEIQGRQQLVRATPILLRCQADAEQSDLILSQLEQGRTFQFFPFGNEPHIGNCFLIGFDYPLPVKQSFEIYLRIFDDYPIRRTAIADAKTFHPLAKLRWEYYTQSGWREVCPIQDETCQFLQNGFLEFCLQEPMAEGENGQYCMRVILEQTWYEVAPMLTGIYLNMLRAVQCSTVADYADFVGEAGKEVTCLLEHRLSAHARFLQKEQDGYRLLDPSQIVLMSKKEGGRLARVPECSGVRVLYEDIKFAKNLQPAVGDGFPNQCYEIGLENVMSSNLQLMVEEADGLWHCWEQVKDFDCSLPDSRHFCFDESSGTLFFGNCEHGMAPTGTIHLVRVVTSEGVDGNVKQHQICEGAAIPSEAVVINHWMASGGRQGETLKQCFARARASLRHTKRAVTNADYEQQVKQAPGLMIQNCRCVPLTTLLSQGNAINDNGVAVVVQPFSNGRREKLNEAYYRNLYDFLDQRRLMGTQVKVLSPEYIGITVFAEIRIHPYYQNALGMIQETVENFFDTANWIFGESVQYSTLYGIIDQLKCVLSVDSLVIDARGAGIGRNRSGDVRIPPNGLVYLLSGEYNLSDGE